MSRAWKITSTYPLLHVNRFRHRRSWNAKIHREKMLGMKNHFDISDSIEIREVDIAGVACTCMQRVKILIIRRVLRHLVWACTVCLCPFLQDTMHKYAMKLLCQRNSSISLLYCHFIYRKRNGPARTKASCMFCDHSAIVLFLFNIYIYFF